MASGAPSTAQSVLEALGEVIDPELDRSIVELGFVRSVSVDQDEVTVELQLPTFWCAPGLTWMMAWDARQAALSVPGVRTVSLILGAHHAGREISEGVTAGRPFEEVFAGEADGGLDELRELFKRKAYLARFSRLVASLPDASVPSALGDLPRSAEVEAYLAARFDLGLDCSPEASLAVGADGRDVEADRLIRLARSVRVSLDANGAQCRALLEARSSLARAAPSVP